MSVSSFYRRRNVWVRDPLAWYQMHYNLLFFQIGIMSPLRGKMDEPVNYITSDESPLSSRQPLDLLRIYVLTTYF